MDKPKLTLKVLLLLATCCKKVGSFRFQMERETIIYFITSAKGQALNKRRNIGSKTLSQNITTLTNRQYMIYQKFQMKKDSYS